VTGGEIKKSFKKREVIFNEGDPGDAAYLIREGSVSLMRKTDSGLVPVATVKAGMLFGEMALLDGSPRMATAVAAEDTVCSVVAPSTFERRLAALEPAIRKMFDDMLKYVRATLPWNVRKVKYVLADETKQDAMVRPLVTPTAMMLPTTLLDPTLAEIYKLLAHYVQRRLPEQPPS
jgi:CRP-like cAMP-binding protein